MMTLSKTIRTIIRTNKHHAIFVSKTPPVYAMVNPTYIGFLDNRYGPFVSSRFAERFGIIPVRAFANTINPVNIIASPNKIKIQPRVTPIVLRLPERSSSDHLLATNQPMPKPTTNINGGGNGIWGDVG